MSIAKQAKVFARLFSTDTSESFICPLLFVDHHQARSCVMGHLSFHNHSDYIPANMYMYTLVCITHMHIYIYILMCTNVHCKHTHTHTCTQTHKHIHVYTCMHKMHIHTCTFTFIYSCAQMYTVNTHTRCTHKHINTT